MLNTIILGSGGHAKVILEVANLLGYNVLGLVSLDTEVGQIVHSKEILGDDSILERYDPHKIKLINGIGAIPKRNIRWDAAYRMRKQGHSFATLIHPNAVISDDVEICEGVQVMAGAIIQPGVKIGQDSIINTGVIVDHDCKIGENCNLSPGVVCSGNVIIESGVYVGAGSTIIQNLSIGKNTIISSGSSIYRDVENDVVFIQPKDEKNTKI